MIMHTVRKTTLFSYQNLLKKHNSNQIFRHIFWKGDVRKPGFQLNSCPSLAKKGRKENITEKVNNPEDN